MNRVGRADLLVILKRWGMEGLEQAARCMDFYLKPEVHNRDEHEKEAFTGALPTPSDEFKVEPIVKETGPLVHFWRAVEYRKKSETEVREDEPDWLKQVESFDVGEIKADRSRSIPSKTPLLPWAGMWPFLFGVLGYYCDTRTVDMERVVELAARARPLSPLPYLQRLTWAGTCQIILDMDDRLLPFWDDQTGLLQGIEKLRGGSGMEVLVFENGPEGLCRGWGKELGELRPYRLPAPGSPILVISDLGCLDTAEAAVKNIVVDETKQKLLRGGQGSPAGAAIEMSVEAIHRSKTSYSAHALQMPPHAVGFLQKESPFYFKAFLAAFWQAS